MGTAGGVMKFGRLPKWRIRKYPSLMLSGAERRLPLPSWTSRLFVVKLYRKRTRISAKWSAYLFPMQLVQRRYMDLRQGVPC